MTDMVALPVNVNALSLCPAFANKRLTVAAGGLDGGQLQKRAPCLFLLFSGPTVLPPELMFPSSLSDVFAKEGLRRPQRRSLRPVLAGAWRRSAAHEEEK